ncbi:glycosyltransferase family 4 protein [Aliikangiella sp. IMCC44359]|uniref:glycosyltransferase family 4 protein n=1 Tax=Aliikangiella sp. IMCC44359 TaxID=3459125 RepID=UPI00403ACFC8
MAIVVISEYIYSEQNSTGYYWSRIISNLIKNYEQVLVITTDEPELEKRSDFSTRIQLKTIQKPKLTNKGTVSKIIYQLLVTLKLIKLILQRVSKNDVVLSGTNPPTLLLAIALLKKFKRFKWQLLVHDIFPENFVPAGIVKRSSFVFRVLKYVFDKAYSSADAISVIGRDMKQLLSDKINSSDTISYIPNWINTEEIVPVNCNESKYLPEDMSDENIVFQFFGNIGRLQGVDNLFEAIKLVKNSRARFSFLGRGPYVNKLKLFISKHPELQIEYKGEVSVLERNLALSSCHIALVTLEEGMYGLGVPSKSYFSMAAAKPLLVVSDVGSEIAIMVNEFDIGWNCEAGNPVKLAECIEKICDKKLHQTVNSPRKVLIENYSEELCLGKFFELTKQLTIS